MYKINNNRSQTILQLYGTNQLRAIPLCHRLPKHIHLYVYKSKPDIDNTRHEADNERLRK